jgi:hypothetical protein
MTGGTRLSTLEKIESADFLLSLELEVEYVEATDDVAYPEAIATGAELPGTILKLVPAPLDAA